MEENERLKEFNENIVESINVGILAADLDDRVESWNTQMERLTGIPREKALGQPLAGAVPRGTGAEIRAHCGRRAASITSTSSRCAGGEMAAVRETATGSGNAGGAP